MSILFLVPAIMVDVLIAFYIISTIICAIICRREKKRKNKITTVSNANGINNSGLKKKRGVVSRTYAFLYPYFYGLIRYMSIVVGKIPSHTIRKCLLKNIFCMDINPKAVIYGGFELRSPWNISIGRSVIGVGALLDGRKGIIIEDDVCLAQAVSIYTEQHDINDPFFRTNEKGGCVTIRHHAWVSSKTTILPRCTVEEGSVIASGATVTKSTVAYGVYAGLPAKLISTRKSPMSYELGGGDYWHFF